MLNNFKFLGCDKGAVVMWEKVLEDAHCVRGEVMVVQLVFK